MMVFCTGGGMREGGFVMEDIISNGGGLSEMWIIVYFPVLL
jgi:hypothetical protein